VGKGHTCGLEGGLGDREGNRLDSRAMPSSRFRPAALAALAVLASACGSGGSSTPPKPPPPPLACTPNTPQASALPAAQVLSLGVHGVGEVVTFSVPQGTGSVTLVQQGVEALQAQTIRSQGTTLDNTVVPLQIKVGGTLFYDDYLSPCSATGNCDPATWGTPDGVGSIYFAAAAPWTGTMTVPNTSNALTYVAQHGGVPAGQWSVAVSDFAAECKGAPSTCVVGDPQYAYPDGRYDLQVLLKPGPVAATGTLDVLVYLVATSPTYAQATAAGSAAQRMVSTLRGLLGNAGITLGTVEFVDMPQDVKNRWSTSVNADSSLPCSDIAEILSLARPGNQMNVFLVNHLDSASSSTAVVVGVDGTIPGPASVGGTLASGALVSAANLAQNCTGAVSFSCGADRTAYIAAHEAGHFLGLYHVTEYTGDWFDPITDTATCPCSTCRPSTASTACYQSGGSASSAYEMRIADCTKSTSCGGGDNLMFWVVGSGSVGSLSAQQASVMRANPAVR
jgi:hypothetical protein